MSAKHVLIVDDEADIRELLVLTLMRMGVEAVAAAWRQYLAAWIACVVGVTSGAAMVPIEATVASVESQVAVPVTLTLVPSL